MLPSDWPVSRLQRDLTMIGLGAVAVIVAVGGTFLYAVGRITRR